MSATNSVKSSYVLPQNATSPRYKMHIVDILIDGGGERTPAYALQFWYEDQKHSIGFRWNGDADMPNGTPNISANACWIVLDEMLWPAVLAAVPDPAKRNAAAKLLYGNS